MTRHVLVTGERSETEGEEGGHTDIIKGWHHTGIIKG